MWLAANLFKVAEGATACISMTDSTVKPCPHCGGTGHMPDGTYEVTSDTVRIVTRLPQHVRLLLKEEISRAKAGMAGPEAVADRFEELADRIREGVGANVKANEEVSESVRGRGQAAVATSSW